MNDGAVVNEDDDTAWIYTMLTIDVLKKNHLKKKKKKLHVTGLRFLFPL